jgi:hypothetical protein
MRPTEDMERLFKEAELTIHPDTDEQVFQDVLQAQQNRTKKSPALPGRIWRMTMKNPIGRLAVAAVVVIACLIGLSLWRGTGSGVALADVLTRLGQVSAYMYQMSSTVTNQAAGMTFKTDMESTMLVSHEHGVKMTMEMHNSSSGQDTLSEMYMLPQKGVWITVMPNEKKYMRMDYDEALLERQQKQNNDPRALVELILRCNYRSLGRSVVDGVEVEGFQTTDPNYLAGMLGQADVKMWVDVKTQLPVRSEQDVQTDQMRMHSVSHNFQWDVAASEADFEPVIPDDYTMLAGGPIKMPAVNEEAAIQGLKLFAELTGQYPEKLDMMTIMSRMGKMVDADTPPPKRLRELGEEMKGVTVEERSRKLIDIMLPIQGISAFHMTLVGGKKDPAYYGQTVTPQDTDKVLMRWKVSDSEYRVIFGDLHTQTVSPEALAELEKGLPK